MRRKVLAASIAMMLGISIWHMNHMVAVSVAITSAAAVYLCHVNGEKRAIISFAAIMLAFFCIGQSLVAVYDFGYDKGRYIDSQRGVSAVAKVTKIEKYAKDEYKFECRLLSINDKKVTGDQRALISYFKELDDPYRLTGKEISFFTKIDAPKEATNPRTFDYSLYLRSRKIGHIATVNYFVINRDASTIADRAMRKTAELKEGFLQNIVASKNTEDLIKGVLFGDTYGMDEDMYDDFRANGTAHILAVSGLHVGVIYGLYSILIKKKKSKILTIGFVGFLLFYGTLTMWSVSVTRAIALVLVITVGDALDRRYDLLTALGTVAIMILVLNPWALFGASFQMSFLAVASISFLQPFLERFMPQSISVMIAVQLGMIPYTAYVFNYVPLLSLLCNIPIIFLLSILVPLGIATLLLFMMLSWTGIISVPLCAMADLMVRLNCFLSHGGMFAVSVKSPPLWVAVLIYASVFFAVSEFFAVYKRRRDYSAIAKVGLVIIIVTTVAFTKSLSPFDKAGLVFVDVGQGDCIHLKTDASTDILIDGGGKIDYNVGKKLLKPYLLKNGCSDIDLALATHLHTDHYQGIKDLTRCFDVKKTVTKGQAGDRLDIGKNCLIEILWPNEREPETDDENLNSLIFKVHVNGVTTLVTGDITEEGEKALVDKYRGTDMLKCDVLKVAHHGSRYSSCNEFLEAVDPEIAVISVGKNNYGHPSNEVIEKLNKYGIIIYRTDQNGAVGIIEKKGRINICVQRKQTIEASRHF